MILDKLNKNCRKAFIELAYGDQEVFCPQCHQKVPIWQLNEYSKVCARCRSTNVHKRQRETLK